MMDEKTRVQMENHEKWRSSKNTQVIYHQLCKSLKFALSFSIGIAHLGKHRNHVPGSLDLEHAVS